MRLPKPWQRKDTGVWYVQIGKKQINLGRDKKKAETKANQLIREAMRNEGVAPAGGYTVGEIVASYKSWLEKNRAPTTASVLGGVLDRFLSAAKCSDLPAHKLTPPIVQVFIDSHPADTSPTTIHTYITNIGGMMNWAVKYGMAESNPIEKMPKPTPRVRQDFLTADQFAVLLDIPHDAAFSDWVRVMLETGARAQEMFKLRSEHYSNGRFTLAIEDSKGKKRSRVIYCPPAAAAIVERLIAENGPGPIFLNSQGQPWNSQAIVQRMRRLKKKLGLPKLCATMLRHSFAHYRLTQGQDPVIVAKLMGHVDTKMIAKRYGHLEGSQFLAEKANELTMPLDTTVPMDRAASLEPDRPVESAPSSPGGGEDASSGKAKRRTA